MKNNREIGKKIAIAFSIVLTVFWLFPYIYVICCSFKPGAEVIAVPPRFFPTVLTVESICDTKIRSKTVCIIDGADLVPEDASHVQYRSTNL